MDLNYTPEDLAFRKQVRAWLEQNLPAAPLRSLDERKVWHRKLYEAGFLGMGWPKEYGGQSARPMEQAIVADEMARSGAPSPTNGLGLGIVGPTIVVHGDEWQKKRYLQKILTAEEMWCQLYSEPNSGSDLASLKTSAEDKGDHFVVNGQKIWTSGGKVADWGLLLARTDPKVAKHKGISCFLMSMRQPGVEVRPLKQMTGSSEFCEVFMTRARVEKDNLIGRLGEGWAIANTTLGYERGGRPWRASPAMPPEYHHLVGAARRLKRHGQPLIESPLVRQKLGKIWADLEVERYNALRVLTQLEKGGASRRGAARSPSCPTRSSRSASWRRPRKSWGYRQLTDGAPPELALEIRGGRPRHLGLCLPVVAGGHHDAGSSEIQKTSSASASWDCPKSHAPTARGPPDELRLQRRPDPPQELRAGAPRRALKPEHVRAMQEDVRGYGEALRGEMAKLAGGPALSRAVRRGRAGARRAALLHEEMGRVAYPGPFLATVILGGLPLLLGGSAAQKEKWLPAIASGRARVTAALQEESLDWNPASIAATATRADAGWTISGVKRFVPWARRRTRCWCPPAPPKACRCSSWTRRLPGHAPSDHRHGPDDQMVRDHARRRRRRRRRAGGPGGRRGPAPGVDPPPRRRMRLRGDAGRRAPLPRHGRRLRQGA